MIIATGAEYRKLPLENLQRFEGNGVYYGATFLEAQLCGNEEVIIVGGGNAAGQAAVFLSQTAKHVHMLIRSGRLADTMSRYLIRRIEESKAITLHTDTEIVGLEGNDRLDRVLCRNNKTAALDTRDIRHVFLMTGANPNTGWLAGCLALDERGFVKTGVDLAPADLTTAQWPLTRRPYLLEASLPGVFAVGDVRSGNVKRVASAVGEGSIAISMVHKVLQEWRDHLAAGAAGSCSFAIYVVLAGIISEATAELARDKPAQISITLRNPNTNAREIDSRIRAVMFASRPEGTSRPASLISFDRTYWRMPGGSTPLARVRLRLKLNNFTITIPRIAMASTPATRATALLMPEAVPARSWSTELITTVVRGATLTASPKPKTTNAGKTLSSSRSRHQARRRERSLLPQ